MRSSPKLSVALKTTNHQKQPKSIKEIYLIKAKRNSPVMAFQLALEKKKQKQICGHKSQLKQSPIDGLIKHCEI